MLDEFKKFILKGNLVTIAVAFIIGVEFSKVVGTFTDVVMGFIGAIVGKPSFNDLVLEIGDGRVPYGFFLTALVNFVIVAFVLFLIIQAYDKIKATEEDNEPLTVEGELLSEIRDLLKAPRS